MARKFDLLATGRYPVYVGEFADGSRIAMSFPTSAKAYAKNGSIEFERGRRLVGQVRNPPFLGNALRGTRRNPDHVPLVRGYVILAANKTIADPMTDTAPKKRGPGTLELRALIGELAGALEGRTNDVDGLLARARQVAA